MFKFASNHEVFSFIIYFFFYNGCTRETSYFINEKALKMNQHQTTIIYGFHERYHHGLLSGFPGFIYVQRIGKR